MLYESFNGYLGFSLFILTTVGNNCMLFAMGDKRAFNTRCCRYRAETPATPRSDAISQRISAG